MKKFFIAMVAVAALIAFAVPAMAAGSMHVRALLDVGYTMNSQERTASGDSVTAVFMNIPGHSYLRGLWMSDDKKAGAHAELGLNSHAFNGTGSTLRYIYGWYKIGACKLVAGHTDSTFGSLAYSPFQHVGFGEAKLLLLGWGNAYSGRHPQVRFEWSGGAFGFSIVAGTPLTVWGLPRVDTGLASVTGFDAATATLVTGSNITAAVAADQYAVFPMIDVVLKFKAGGFMTTPGFRWSQLKNKYAAGSLAYEDTVNSWALHLPVKFAMGAFAVAGQFFYGQNLNNIIALHRDSVALWNGTSVLNTKTYGGSIGATFKTGALKIGVGFGYVRNQNDAWTGAVNDYTSRYAAFISARYQVTKNFYVHPEVSYWNYGDSTAGTSNGNEWLLGVQFGFIF